MGITFNKQEFIVWVKQYTDYESLKTECASAFAGFTASDPTIFFSKLKEVAVVSEKIIVLIEKASKDLAFMSSKDKLDAAVDFIDELIKVPTLLEWADGIVIKSVISTIVLQYNKIYGNKWLEVVDGNK